MTHMRSATTRRALAGALVALALMLAPAVARADAGPQLAPQAVFTEGFESVPFARAVTAWVTPTPGDPSPAFWGRVTQRRHSGSYGLWCAGAIPSSTSNGWTTYSGRYPAFTAGAVTFDVPELADYYSATLGYWYNMPTMGSRDVDRFNVVWAPAGTESWESHTGQAIVTTMTQRAYQVTAPTNVVNLSRTAGKIRFLFIDDVDVFESPSVGEGPSIDDVTVSGFKYGPVRNLAAQVSGGRVTLTWATPVRSTAPFAPVEERPLAYRVWRSPNTAPYVWTEVTSLRVSTTTFTDELPLDGAARYVVQAWDTGSGTGYGEVDLGAAAVAVVIPPIPVSSVEITGGSPSDGVYTELPTITVSRSTLAGSTLYRWDGGGWASSSAQSFTIPSLVGTHTLEVYSRNTLGDAETPSVTRLLVVRPPVDPGPSPVTTISVGGTTDAGGTYTATPTITVTRDQMAGETWYRWSDAGSWDTTTAATFTIAPRSGTSTLEAYSISSSGLREAITASRTLVVNVQVVRTKPSLSTPTLSTSRVRRYRTFYVRGTVKPSHAGPTTVKLLFYRYYSGSYHWVKSKTLTLPAGATSYSLKTSLSRSATYRVKAHHSCPLHLSTYSSSRKFYVYR